MNIFRKDLTNKPEIKIAVPIKKHMMCLNESSLNPLEILSDKISKKLKSVELNRYISNITQELTTNLTHYIGHNINKNQVLFGNGVDELLYFIFTAVREYKTSFAVSLSPSYFDYKTYSGSVDLEMQFLNFNQDFNFSVEDYIEKLQHPDCKLGIICNPNNPTGHLIPDKKIIHIIQSTKKPIIIDETYFEFAGTTFIDKIKEYPNIIILRSFSKSFSAAGLRFGYLISSEQNIQTLNKVIPVFHCSILTQVIASTILENKEIFIENVKQTIEQKEYVFNQMKKIGSKTDLLVYPSFTNFLIFSLGKRSVEFYEFLQSKDISIRPVWNHPLLLNHLRVTISDKQSNEAFLNTLKEFLNI